MVRANIFIILILILLSNASCKNDVDDILTVDRTIIIYMAADNSLSTDAMENLRQIENAYYRTGAKVIVFIDTSDDFPCLLEITEKGSVVVKKYPEFNSVSAEKMKEILVDIINTYPSDNYGLILWSHGTSWFPSGSNLRAFGIDDNLQLNIPELVSALPIYFDFIIFDACLMGSIEVAYELKDRTKYIIASSTEIISSGYPYNKIIKELIKPTIDFRIIAQMCFDFYNKMEGAYRSATISLIDTRYLTFLAEDLNNIIRENNIDSTFQRTDVQRLDRYDEQYTFDLNDYVNNLFPYANKHLFLNHLNKVVLYKNSTPMFLSTYEINYYCGLSCYILKPGKTNFNNYYKLLKWYKDAGINKLF